MNTLKTLHGILDYLGRTLVYKCYLNRIIATKMIPVKGNLLDGSLLLKSSEFYQIYATPSSLEITIKGQTRFPFKVHKGRKEKNSG